MYFDILVVWLIFVSMTLCGDERWEEWGEWSSCPVTCGRAPHVRHRSCKLSENQKVCPEEGQEDIGECDKGPCPVDGKWSQWSDYRPCTVTCGQGKRVRTRKCNNPPPAFGGQGCHGQSTQTTTCSRSDCPIHGKWSAWSSWSDCSVTCDQGIHERSRMCNNPPPSLKGKDCEGIKFQTDVCVMPRRCPIDGRWSNWSEWGVCTTSDCNKKIGYWVRTRLCNNPLPMFEGKMCKGQFVDKSGACFDPENCSTDGGWGLWSSWVCHQNIAKRIRFCDNPPRRKLGRECVGDSTNIYLRSQSSNMFYKICPHLKPTTNPDV
ncbi:properdin-like isoform X3 [Tachypleus tridentatus]|uniref:properdin-like isoform X3 n=1 Tax=Tachypleus tridentatus TaxID=6853 RepID=UPI003FD43B96